MQILLPFHIIIALSGLVYTVVLFFRPSQAGLQASYGLTALTFITGFALIIIKPVHITQTCITGLVYLGIMLTGIFVARHKLAGINIKK